MIFGLLPGSAHKCGLGADVFTGLGATATTVWCDVSKGASAALDEVRQAKSAQGASLVTLHLMSDEGPDRRRVVPDPVAWAKGVGAIAAAFRGQAPKGEPMRYAILNELSARTFAGTVADYVAMLRAAYKAIKQADPSALVCDSGIASASPQSDPFAVARFDKASGYAADYDVVTVHYYRGRGNFPTLAAALDSLKTQMTGSGVRKLIEIHELGYGKPESSYSASEHAKAVTEDIQTAAKYGVSLCIYSLLADKGEMARGLYDASGQRRPAADAYQKAVKAVGGPGHVGTPLPPTPAS